MSAVSEEAGKYARYELERRFLLDRLPEGIGQDDGCLIVDRYIKGLGRLKALTGSWAPGSASCFCFERRRGEQQGAQAVTMSVPCMAGSTSQWM